MEVAEAMDDALKALGAFDSEGTPIVFGAHLEKRLPDNALIYNAEQVFSWDYLQTLKKHRVWDYSGNNISALAAKGVKAELVPIAYMPSMTRFNPADIQDIDVLIYGSHCERRDRVYNELKRMGVKAEFVFGMYGAERDELIARSRVVLNIHFYPEGVHEIFRTAHLMSNRAFVVSEVGRDLFLEEPLHKNMVFCKYEELANMCTVYLAGGYSEESGDRETWRGRGFMNFRKTSMVDSLRGVL